MEDLIQKLNDLKILQTSGEWTECLPDEIYTEYFEGKYTEVDGDLDVDKRRHYEYSTSVICFDEDPSRYLGVRVISKLYSDMSMWEDVYHYLEFFEMKEITTVTYVRK